MFETPEAGSGGAPEAAPAQGGGEQAAGGGIDLSAIEGRLEDFGNRFGAIEDRLGVGGDESYDPYDDDGGDQGDDNTGPGSQEAQVTPEQAEQQQALEALQAYIKEQVNEGIKPAQQQAQDAERFIQLSALEDAYPDLKKEEVAGPVVQEALQLGHSMGMSREQATHPDFIERIYLAGRALSGAEGETPAGESQQGEVALESSGGASRGAQEEDPAMAIVNSGPKRSFLTGGQ